MADDKIQTPTSSAGIMRFYDVSSSKIQLDAKVVLGVAVALILLEIVLKIAMR
ncbi:MAG TPA: preprotein translocase subunit Sec61beta [Candidatus Norongarragalinales archaeon]|nr:preprotein translocase subunit Sec61beta [Candidatus Norongarragalinales archaeon]